MTDICRLCLSIISSSPIPVYKDHILLQDQIKYLLPEIDLMLTPTYDFCNLCVHLLSTAYIFKRGCLKTEETIKMYISQHNNIPINLHEVKKLESSCSSLNPDILEDVKVEPLNVEINIESETDVRRQLNVTFICNECHKTFEDEETLEKHQKDCLFYKCDLCEKILVTKDEYDIHRESHSILETQTNSISNNTSGPESNVHNLDSPIEKSTTCDICQSVFSSQMELQTHKLSHEASSKKYCCNLCNKSYAHIGHLRIHKTRHTRNKNKKCTKCDIIFRTAYLLELHVATKHRGPIICETCGKEFTTQWLLTKHIRSHTGERPYKCLTCGMGFNQKSTLTIHIQSKHAIDRPYKCKICDKSFAVPLKLKVHLETHAKPDEKLFPCSYEGCDKSFKTEKDRGKHLWRHKAGKPHKCETCGRAFADRNSLRIHNMLHTGEKPFRCSLCDKAFSRKYTLDMHLKSHRGKDQNFEMVKVEETMIVEEQPPLS